MIDARAAWRLRVAALNQLLVSFAATAQVDPLSETSFRSCVARLADETKYALRPLSRADFQRIAATAKYDDRSRAGSAAQVTEVPLWWDELAATTDDERVRDGHEVLQRNAAALQRIEHQYGVPRSVLVAIYGIESDYGRRAGSVPVLDAALSLACLRPCSTPEGRCLSRERAYAATRLIRDAQVSRDSFNGSWAAAFGLTQFVPDTFEELAVDFDGDGRKDVIGSEPDALASTANHLSRRGRWAGPLPALIEVTVPSRLAERYASRGETIRLPDARRPLSQWLQEGWTVLDAQSGVPPDTPVYPFLPVGLPGPAFLATGNADAIFRYNQSLRYVAKIALLARKLSGEGDFRAPWPTEDPGLSRAAIRRLQEWLLQRGHDIGAADGIVGTRTRDAIERERAARGMPPDRRVGKATLPVLMQP